MRLLNVETMKLEEFIGDDTPPYTILSHTWEREEVTFPDLTSGNFEHLEGYQKLAGCCERTRQEGYQYTWIDTCCIDKSSSAELSEAINSMFRWYQKSDVCYAYLSDIQYVRPTKSDHRLNNSHFIHSKWFTRGWTLQELLAPDVLVFFTSSWIEIGSKTSDYIARLINDLTGISVELFTAASPLGENIMQRLRNCSIAQKMSWAARRKTTRREDQAYCLLGLFEVNMPLLYGEGPKAFVRLQQEIMKESNDCTIFAWKFPREQPKPESSGLLAVSVECFEGQQGVTKSDFPNVIVDSQTPLAIAYEITKSSLRMRVLLFHRFLEIVSDLYGYQLGLICRLYDVSPIPEPPRFTEITKLVKSEIDSPSWPYTIQRKGSYFSIVLLGCRDAYGRIGFCVSRNRKGELQRSHWVAFVYLPNDVPEMGAAEYHLFQLIGQHLDLLLPPRREYAVELTSLLYRFGYAHTIVIGDLSLEKSHCGDLRAVARRLSGKHCIIFQHADSENWPALAVDVATWDRFPWLGWCSAAVYGSKFDIQGEIFKRRPETWKPNNTITPLNDSGPSELTLTLNREHVLVMRLRQGLSAVNKITLFIEHRDDYLLTSGFVPDIEMEGVGSIDDRII